MDAVRNIDIIYNIWVISVTQCCYYTEMVTNNVYRTYVITVQALLNWGSMFKITDMFKYVKKFKENILSYFSRLLN